MHKGRSYEDTCPEVSREEEKVVGDWEAWEAADNDREGTCWGLLSVVEAVERALECSPNVLRTRIITSAAKCKGVLYDALPSFEPHVGLSGLSSRRRSSAWRRAVGISTHDAGCPAQWY